MNLADRRYGIGRGLSAIRAGTIRSSFLWWAVASQIEHLRSLGNGTTFDAVTTVDVERLPVPFPPLSEQRRIAEFLDTETGRIDTLITEYQQQIELLEEQRLAEIRAVLWSYPMAELRRIADLLPGYAFSSGDFGEGEGGPPLLRGTSVGIGKTRWDDTVHLSLGVSYESRYELRDGDVVLGMDRPFISGGTRVARIEPSDAGCLLVQRVCRIRADQPDVVVAALSGSEFRSYIESDLTGVSVPHLSEAQIGRFRIPVSLPAAPRQKIADAEASHENLATVARLQIANLQELRQALITTAVSDGVEACQRVAT